MNEKTMNEHPTGHHAKEYDPHTIRLVHSTLERVLRCFGPAREHITVIGGLVPSLLIPSPKGEAHVGTTDADLCLTVALADGDTSYYDSITTRLRDSGFVQRTRLQRFRWEREGVVVDFLYPADLGEDTMRTLRDIADWERSTLASLGEEFAALAVPCRHLITATREQVRFRPELDGAVIPDAWVYITGPAAFAALKAYALSSTGRFKPKDAYDVVWILDEMGPQRAAERTIPLIETNLPAAKELLRAVDMLDELFSPGKPGPVWYANFIEDGEDKDVRAVHERFARETVVAFTDAVRRSLL